MRCACCPTAAPRTSSPRMRTCSVVCGCSIRTKSTAFPCGKWSSAYVWGYTSRASAIGGIGTPAPEGGGVGQHWKSPPQWRECGSLGRPARDEVFVIAYPVGAPFRVRVATITHTVVYGERRASPESRSQHDIDAAERYVNRVQMLVLRAANRAIMHRVPNGEVCVCVQRKLACSLSLSL